MANNYYQATGLIKLTKITPVIKALFGAFDVQEHDGGAYIACDESDISYEAVGDSIAKVMGFDPAGTVNDYLIAMADNLGKKTEVEDLLTGEYLESDEDASLGVLFRLALLMDDGHGVVSLWQKGAWTCSKPRLGEFGGNGYYISKNFSIYSSSDTSNLYGAIISEAIDKNDLAAVVERISSVVEDILNGISDDSVRASVTALLAESLRNKSEPIASPSI